MHKTHIITLLSLLLSGCSYTQFLPGAPTSAPPTATATATIYMTPTQTASITPTQPTQTFTSTPTLLYPNGTPEPSLTPSPLPTLWIIATASGDLATAASQPLVGNGPFQTVLVGGKQLFWGSCEPSSVKVTVQVAHEVPAAIVLIMLRLQGVKTGDTTEWGGGAIMDKQDNGVFTYTLTAKSFTHYREYLQALGQYQFVALDANRQRLGASTQYLNNLTIAPCP